MFGRIQADNFFNTTIDSLIDDVSLSGTFTIASKTVNGYTLEDGAYMFWMVVGLQAQATLEVFRITNVSGTTLTYDKRISPGGLNEHTVGSLCVMTVASEFNNRLSDNTSDFGYVETVTGTGNELKIKAYGGRANDITGDDIVVSDTTFAVPINSTDFVYYDDINNIITYSTSESPQYNVLARVITNASSVSSIDDYRSFPTNIGAIPKNLTNTQITALTGVRNGTIVFNSTTGLTQRYESGVWNDFSTGTPPPRLTDTLEGKGRRQTNSEFVAGTDTGSDGASLISKPSQLKNREYISITFNESSTSAIGTVDSGDAIIFIDSVDDKVKVKDDTQSISTLASEDYVDDSVGSYFGGYRAGETLSAGQCVFVESPPITALATTKQDICKTSADTRVSIPVIGTGVAATTFILNLCKTGSPGADLNFRIETDNAGSPSGTLFAGTATAAVTAGSLTTSLVQTTVTLGASQTLTAGTMFHIVMFQGTYGSETVSGTNYYNIGYQGIDSNIRGFKLRGGASRGSMVATKFAYIYSLGFTTQLLSLTDSDFEYKSLVYGISNGSYSKGLFATTTVGGLDTNQSGLTAGIRYYLSGTPGAISATQGTNISLVGIAKSTTEILFERGYYPSETSHTLNLSVGTNTAIVTTPTWYPSEKLLVCLFFSVAPGSNSATGKIQYSVDENTWSDIKSSTEISLPQLSFIAYPGYKYRCSGVTSGTNGPSSVTVVVHKISTL